MADAITMQGLIDANLDVETLGEAANEDKVVVSRLGREFPSAPMSSRIILEQGTIDATLKTTKAALDADTALVDDDFALVYNDGDVELNGYYQKQAGVWEYLPYNLQRQAINKIEQAKQEAIDAAAIDAQSKADAAAENAISEAQDYTESLVEHNSNDYLEIRVDANGNPYSATNAEGGLLLPDVEGTLQDVIRPLKQDKSNESLRVLGSNDLDALLLSDTGALHVDDVVNKDGAVSSQLAKVSSTARDTSYDVAYKTHETIDGVSAYGDTPSNVQHVLADASEYPPNKSLFGASIARTGKHTYYLSYDVRETGHDYDPIFLVGRTVTFDPVTRTFTSGTSTLLADAGTATSGLPYAHLNPTVSYIEFGANAGRILVHFNYMEVDVNDLLNNIYRPCYVYSDDGGANFSDVIYMDSMFPMSEWGDLLNFGTGHGVQIQSGEHKGRLVLSAYHRHPTAVGTLERKRHAARVIYSDDGGDTYQIGALLDSPRLLSEWQVVNTFDGGLVGLARIGSNTPEKYIAYSYDGGMTFSEPQIVDRIRGAGLKIGFAQIANNYDYSTPKLIASCPSDPNEAGNVRADAAVWVSYDDGKTFPHKQQVDLGVAQYSDVVSLDEHSILYIYCGGTDSRGNQVLAHILNLNFLLEK